MALIKELKGGGEAYARVLGSLDLGKLISKVQAGTIAAGTELEKMIYDQCAKIEDLDKFLGLSDYKNKKGVFVASKQQVKKSKKIHSQYEPDLVVFDTRKRICYAIEVKDGQAFDTKKSSSEHKTLHDFVTHISQKIRFSCECRICGFNSKNKEELHVGLKGKFPTDELILGTELCDLLGINYNQIVEERKRHQPENLKYFITQMLKIDKVRSMIQKILRKY